MGYLPTVIAAAAADRTVRAALLVHFDFEDDPKRFWMGCFDLVAGGETWQGFGDLVAIDGLDQIRGMSAPKATFTVSGISPDIVALARDQSDKVKGRDVTVYLQFFDEEWQTLDDPVVVWIGILDVMTYSAQGPNVRSIQVSAEGLWTGRRRPVFARYTDRDQQGRFPGDLGCSQVADNVSKTLRWPNYV